jgi:hypothetical protein
MSIKNRILSYINSKQFSGLIITWIGRIALGYQLYKYLNNQIENPLVELFVLVLSVALIFKDVKWILDTASKKINNSNKDEE